MPTSEPYELTKPGPGHFETTTKSSFVHRPSTDWVTKSAPPAPNYQRAPIELTKAEPGHYTTTTRETLDAVAAAARRPPSSDPSSHYRPPTDVQTTAAPNHFTTTTTASSVAYSAVGTPARRDSIASPVQGSPAGLSRKSSSVAGSTPRHNESGRHFELSPSPNTADGVPHRQLRYDPPTTTATVPDHYTTSHRSQYSVPPSPVHRVGSRSSLSGVTPAAAASPLPHVDTWLTSTQSEYREPQPNLPRQGSCNKSRYSQDAVRTTATPDNFVTTNREQFDWASRAGSSASTPRRQSTV